MNRRLIIRADANSRMGTGHVMRCLALAQYWMTHCGDVRMLSCCNCDVIRSRLKADGIDLVSLDAAHPAVGDLELTLKNADEWDADWIVADGYHFDLAFQQGIRQGGRKLLLIDDYNHLDRYDADILLNQNVGAEHLDYSLGHGGRRLLGSRYALLRKEFVQTRPPVRPYDQKANRVLVVFGGADPDNVTLKVLKALNTIDDSDMRVRAVVGGANPHMDLLRSESEAWSERFEILQNVMDMPALMLWADLAVSAGGSTCWELCYSGVPALILILAENQKTVTAGLAAAGAAENLGWFEGLDEAAIAESLNTLRSDAGRTRTMSRKGRELVDGKGSNRVARELQRAVLAPECSE